MNFKTIIYEKKDHVARITLNRPSVMNALNEEMRKDLKQALRNAEFDEDIRAVLITGSGGNFSAGADIKELLSLKTSAKVDDWLKLYGIATLTEIITGMRKPVIAAVDGYCVGGGFELIQSVDIVIATDKAKFGATEIRVGLFPGGSGTQMLPRIVGLHKAKELIFTGNIISAEEAEKIGLVNKVVPVEKLEEEVEKLIKRILDKSPLIIALAKEAVNLTLENSFSTGLKKEKKLFLRGWETEDRVEGLKAFLEKRKPVFRGR